MKEYKYDYTISKENSPIVFKEICEIISSNFSDFKVEELLVDVDGSTIQVYSKGDEQIVVYDDYDIGAVFIKSDIDLTEIIKGREAA
jgi:hypothetical protein